MAQFIRDIDPIRPLLDRRPLGIFSDIDGTLAPIVANPEAARVSPRNREILQELTRMDVRVALISGRSVAAAREMTGVHGLSYAGVHGLEIAVGGTIEPTPGLEDAVAGARAVLRDVAGLKVDGLIVEDKGPTVAFHYRNALNEWAARAAILDAIGRSQAAEAFNVHEGRKVVELRPPTEANKGTATTELAARLGVKAIVCIGDDITDLDMFSACIGLRDQGTEVAVVAARSQEVAREVMDAAEYCVDGVSGVEWLLGEIVSALR